MENRPTREEIARARAALRDMARQASPPHQTARGERPDAIDDLPDAAPLRPCFPSADRPSAAQTAGYVRAQVLTADGGKPVAGATAALLQADADSPRTLAQGVTDGDGQTPPLALPAPPPLPGQEEAVFAHCDLLVTRPGFRPVLTRDLPVFAGLVTVQTVPLTPAEAPGGDTVAVYTARQPGDH